MNLKHLTDAVLLADTKFLAARERELTVKILHHIREIERRKLFSELRFPSIYEYCIQELGYTDAAAHRRIVAARMLRDIPEIESKIEDGSLSLSNIAQAGKFFKDQDIKTTKEKKEVLKKNRKSKQEGM